MAKQIYKTAYIELIDGTELYITPLKIKYLREFMEEFDKIKNTLDDTESLDILLNCAKVAMRQYHPALKTKEEVEDSIDIKTLYKILEICAGIKLDEDKEESVKDQAASEENSSWDSLDLVSLESEVFMLGIWKDYEDLESSLCMEELTEILNTKREIEYNDKKFMAAMQGVDLDKQSGKQKEDPWEAMKARVFSRGMATSSKDILSLQGVNAQRAGFGIGNGLSYENWD